MSVLATIVRIPNRIPRKDTLDTSLSAKGKIRSLHRKISLPQGKGRELTASHDSLPTIPPFNYIAPLHFHILDFHILGYHERFSWFLNWQLRVLLTSSEISAPSSSVNFTFSVFKFWLLSLSTYIVLFSHKTTPVSQMGKNEAQKIKQLAKCQNESMSRQTWEKNSELLMFSSIHFLLHHAPIL